MKKNSPLILVATETKFKKSDYNRYEIAFLKKYSNIEIWDISPLSSKSFHKNISSETYSGKYFKLVKSYKQLILLFIKLKKNYKKNNVYLMNFVTPSSFGSLIFLILVKNSEINHIKYLNPGVPSVDTKFSRAINFFYLYNYILKRLYNLLSKILNIFPSHCIYSGSFYKNKCQNIYQQNKTKCVPGNSWDFSNILSKKDILNKLKRDMEKNVVLLDGAGPKFFSDDRKLFKKTFFTKEIWYPALVSFFEKIEKKTNSKVVIAGHPKTLIATKSPLFGYRSVFYRKTLELVLNSKFVITRQSTSISYAVVFKKPIIFIYNEQLKKDEIFMNSIKKISGELGMKPFNIDDDKSFFLITCSSKTHFMSVIRINT